jgi:hypothetical protein
VLAPAIVLAAGGAVLATGIALWIVGSGTPTGCTRQGAFELTCLVDVADAGRTNVAIANTAVAAFIVGGVAVLGGGAWMTAQLAGSHRESRPVAWVEFDEHGAYVIARTRF